MSGPFDPGGLGAVDALHQALGDRVQIRLVELSHSHEGPGSHGTEVDRLVLCLLGVGLALQLEGALLHLDDARAQLGPGRPGEPEVGVPFRGGAPLTLFEKAVLVLSVAQHLRRPVVVGQRGVEHHEIRHEVGPARSQLEADQGAE